MKSHKKVGFLSSEKKIKQKVFISTNLEWLNIYCLKIIIGCGMYIKKPGKCTRRNKSKDKILFQIKKIWLTYNLHNIKELFRSLNKVCNLSYLNLH